METPERTESLTDRVLGFIFLCFVMAFMCPIMWLAEKIQGGGSGAGPALASFMVSALIVFMTMISALMLILGIMAFVIYRMS